MSVTKHASSYVKFLNLVNAVRQTPSLPSLDVVEERLLSVFLTTWESGKQVPVTDAARMVEGTPERTAFRRIKSLHEKGLVTFEHSPSDHRIKYIVPTKAAEQYFDSLGKCMEQARNSFWPTSRPTE